VSGFFVFLSFLIILSPDDSKAQAKAATAQIVGEFPYVYTEPNFDSEIIAELVPGDQFTISQAKRGPFHRILLKPGLQGWISESEIKITSNKALPPVQKKVSPKSAPKSRVQGSKELKPRGAPKTKTGKKPSVKKKSASPKEGDEPGDIFFDADDDISDLENSRAQRKKLMLYDRHMGLAIDTVQFTEDTMGGVRTAPLTFFGFRMAGAETLFDGIVTADTHLLFAPNAPSYYRSVTGEGASGFAMLGHFQLLTQNAISRDVIYHYGFGPMLKYSSFQLKRNGQNFTADDVALGAVFGLGLGFRFGPWALRPDFKYYWERSRYWSLGLGILWSY
jgi:hypothetical protein